MPVKKKTFQVVPTPEEDPQAQAALQILSDIANSDSRWADLSGRDSAVVEYAVSRGWLETDERNLKFSRYMLTKRGLRALDTDD